MSLERTYKSLANLENEKHITASQMFDFMVGFVSEIYKHNGIKGISGLDMGDRENLVFNAFALCDMLLSVVNSHQEVILMQDDALALQNIFSQIEDIHKKLSVKSEEIQDLKLKREELVEASEKLQKETQALLEVKKECDSLEDKIKELNDIKLLGVEEKRDSLKNDLRTRQNKHSIIVENIKSIEAEIAVMEAELKKKKDENIKISDIKKEKELEFELLSKEKKSLELTLCELEQKKNECDSWIKNFRTIHSEMEKNIAEYSARYREIYLALNCIFNEEFIRDHIFSVKEAQTKLITENYPDLGLFVCEIKNFNDLRRWLDALQKRIESLIDVYQEELRKIHDCSSVITEEK
jgi:novel protein (fragment)